MRNKPEFLHSYTGVRQNNMNTCEKIALEKNISCIPAL